jgi:hypothetical protein
MDMLRNARGSAVGMALLLGACAHTSEEPPTAPDFSEVPTTASPNARFYADCIADAVRASRYGRASDGDTEMVLFTCVGPTARAFYDALGPHSFSVSSQVQAGGRTLRSTNPVRANLFGVDYCSTDNNGDYRCVISLNAGAFLAQ